MKILRYLLDYVPFLLTLARQNRFLSHLPLLTNSMGENNSAENRILHINSDYRNTKMIDANIYCLKHC